MKEKQKNILHFSYLDLLIVLAFGLILSIGMYFYGESTPEPVPESVWNAEFSAWVKPELEEAIPRAGLAVLNEKEEVIGEVTDVRITWFEREIRVTVWTRQTESPGRIGNAYRLETPTGILVMQVENVETEEFKEKGLEE